MNARDESAAHQARRNEELDRFRQLFAQTPSFAAVVVGRSHRHLLANPAYRRLIGGREVLGRTVAEALPEVVDQGFVALLDRVYAGGEAHVATALPIAFAQDGGEARRYWLDFVLQPIRDDDGRVVALFFEGSDATERHLASEALRASEARNRQILDSAIDYAIIATDPDGCITRWNTGAERVLGWSEAEMLGRTIERLFTPEDRAAGLPALEMRAALDAGSGSDEGWRLRRSGERFWASGEITPIRDDAGEVTGFVKVLRDRTDEHAAGQAIAESEQRFRAFTEAVPNHVWSATPDGRLDWVNNRAYAYGGHDEAQMLSVGWERRLHPEDVARARAAWHAALASGDEYEAEFRLRRHDGAYRWHLARAVPLRDEAGAIVRWIGTNTDIDDERAARRQLGELAATLEERVEQRTQERDRAWANSQDLQAVADFDGFIRAASDAWRRVLGHDPADVVDRHYLHFVHPDDRADSIAAFDVTAVEGIPPFENRMLHADGTWRWISWVIAPEQGLVYASGRHVTAEKEAAAALEAAQEQLRQSQKMEAVGQLTGGVAHDFNNLLTVIRGSVDLLRRGTVTPERQARYIDAIADTADRAAKLTGQLLAFARRQTLNPEPFDVRDSLREIVGMIETLTGSRIALDIRLPADACPVRVDRSQLDTAIVNMAINARDAMQGRGTLTVAVEPVVGVPRVRAHAAAPGDYVAVTIRDTGEGIAADILDRVFEPFFTTKKVGEGTGLGLSQVIGFAKQSGGDIRVESAPGAGTTFTLYLPRAATAVPGQADDANGAAEPAGEGARVLVVEDNAPVGAFAQAALEELGYRSTLAEDGARALAALEAEPAAYNLVFSDVMMPGMTGLELADAIGHRYPDLPVVLTSGYCDLLARGGSHGRDLLQKPYSVDQLSRTLRKALQA